MWWNLVCDNSFKGTGEKRRKDLKRVRGEKSNWICLAVPYGSMVFSVHRGWPQADWVLYTVAKWWQTSLSSLQPTSNLFWKKPTLNQVRGIIKGANNEGAFGVLEKKGGAVKWPTENTIKQDWNSKGLTMRQPALFCATPLVGRDKGIPQYS